MFIIESWEALLKLNVGQSTVCNGTNVGEELFELAFYSNKVLRYIR